MHRQSSAMLSLQEPDLVMERHFVALNLHCVCGSPVPVDVDGCIEVCASRYVGLQIILRS